MKHTDERFFDDTEMDLFLLSLHPPIALFQCPRYVQNICITAREFPFFCCLQDDKAALSMAEYMLV